ncbi:nucleoside-diphosphate sugar epimerase/dehydratase [Georgenia muralis]|nr:hypothetical protein [Georgenia muralis]
MTMILWDALAWIGAILLVVGSRYDFALTDAQWDRIFLYATGAIALQVVVGTVLKLYRGRYRVGSFEEPLALAASTLFVAGTLGLVFYLLGYGDFPVGIAVLVPPVAAMIMGAARWLYRAWGLRSRPSSANAEPVLVYGAGDAGNQLLRLLNRDANSPYRAVGLIDDDPAKRNLTLHGVPVLGNRSDLLPVCAGDVGGVQGWHPESLLVQVVRQVRPEPQHQFGNRFSTRNGPVIESRVLSCLLDVRSWRGVLVLRLAVLVRGEVRRQQSIT